jgi:hypothetical protein
MREWADIICASVRSGRSGPEAPTFGDGLACSRVMTRLREPVQLDDSHQDEEPI